MLICLFQLTCLALFDVIPRANIIVVFKPVVCRFLKLKELRYCKLKQKKTEGNFYGNEVGPYNMGVCSMTMENSQI